MQAASATQAPGECRDNHASCPQWAKLGECQKNPVYMRGNENVRGNCRLSCKVGFCWAVMGFRLCWAVMRSITSGADSWRQHCGHQARLQFDT